MRKKLILLRGLPGSGKTTFATFLTSALDTNVSMFAADDFFYDDAGEYHFNMDLLHKAHMDCELRVQVAMSRALHAEEVEESPLDETIIVHNTLTTEKEMKPYLQLALQYGFEVTSLIVENRHDNESVHNVPEEVMKRMKDRFSVKL